jgi:hypothetical protein
MKILRTFGLVLSVLATTGAAAQSAAPDRAARINERFVFADIHAHPSRFHRANVDRIDAEEIARYRRGLIDLVVCNVSSDAAFQGGYTARDGSTLRRLQGNDRHPLQPGQAVLRDQCGHARSLLGVRRAAGQRRVGRAQQQPRLQRRAERSLVQNALG